ncbi:hypothetical protein [Streptomyces sp. NBC_01451]|uniref:hypothetical protein n=1 Tax=Streptomyces sp. NBC_01451 TaxID=2903872 RepID=UPI002E3430DD|nr:hypothetical protein [Streptomyces sp. NBC_01451]
MLAAVAAAVMATGCSGTAASQDAKTVPAGALRPLTDTEQLRIADAEQRLIKQCMNRQGFTYWEAERPSLEESRTLGYVADDVAWARKHGYGSRIAAKEDRARLTNPNLVYRKGLSEERRKAYDDALDGGIDAPEIMAELPNGATIRRQMGGCVAEAEKRLYGDPEAWFRANKIASNLQPLYVPQVMRDKQFVAALSVWSTCMEHAGHPEKDPGAARQAAKERALRSTSDETFAAERRLAVADATCARTASLAAIGKERETHYVNALRGRYGQALDTSRRIEHEAYVRAADIVGPRT